MAQWDFALEEAVVSLGRARCCANRKPGGRSSAGGCGWHRAGAGAAHSAVPEPSLPASWAALARKDGQGQDLLLLESKGKHPHCWRPPPSAASSSAVRTALNIFTWTLWCLQNVELPQQSSPWW